MSRTFRKKYIPLYYREFSDEMIERIKSSLHYAAFGVDENGGRWYTTHWRHKSGCADIRFINSIGRDGTNDHGSVSARVNNSRKQIPTRMLREKLRQELRNMKAGQIPWDGNIENPNKIRANIRGMYQWEMD